jgi:hypothetical protein
MYQQVKSIMDEYDLLNARSIEEYHMFKQRQSRELEMNVDEWKIKE